MSEDFVEAPAPATVTAGQMLRQAREAAGLHVAALAVSLKVPVNKLEALEADRLDLLPDSVFVRALASSVCRALKIDARPILDLLPQNAPPRLVQDRDGLNTPYRSPGDQVNTSWVDQLSKPVFLAVFALLLGALVLILLPTTQRDEGQGAGKTPQPVAAPGPAAAPPTALAQGMTVEAVTAPSAAASQNQPATMPAATPAAPAVAAVPPPVTTPAPVPSVPTATQAATPPVAAVEPARPAEPPAAGTVVFRTKGRSWVQVVDAKGGVVLQKLMESGEAAGASGALPLTVTVGSVDTTQVQVRGKPFDLAPVSRDNVARFEVK